MSEVLFIVIAVVLYFACDRGLDFAERRAGRRFEHRTLIFFGLLLGTALIAFWALRHLTSA
ncbi:MAG: hypothetical protein HN420_18495 [Rhodospirillaceae bacterium]|jgi:hypothetical protein|nr:hypothetical protein [Rhodospirillaceae bacterium]MBT5414790.1 hypothetical protein [Rhodospirillaceae bacterium]